MIKAIIVLLCVISTAALRPGQKAAPAILKKAAPAPVKSAPAPVKSAPTPVKSAPAPAKKVAAPLPKPPAPKKVAAPAPKPAAPAPKKAAAPAPKSVTPAKTFQASSGFASGLIGSDIEAGEFDPLELSAGRSAETLAWYRAAELKHGRICMLAALGLFVQPFVHLPDEVFSSKAGYGALSQIYNERPEAIWQILVALGAIEVSSLFSNGQGSAGDLGFDPLNFKSKYPEQDAMQLRELKNGRLAMLGASGLLLQEAAAHHAPFDF